MASDLESTAKALVAEGKGILAADESGGTIKKRFDSIGVESTEDNRRAYRELLFTTEGAEDSSAASSSTTRRSARGADGTPFPKLLERKGIIPGIKVDNGREAARGRAGRDDHRRPRRPARAPRGVPRARRAVHQVARRDHDRRRASRASTASRTNAHALARYAALCQEAGLVPIVEPEVLMDGDHTIERSFDVTSQTLHAVFTELRDQRVQLEGMLLKPNMVLSGYDASEQAGADEVAEQTLRCFSRHVPAAVPGIVFLSGGQSDEDATAHLNAMNALGRTRGSSRSPTAARCRRRRSRRGRASRRTSRRRSTRTTTAPG